MVKKIKVSYNCSSKKFEEKYKAFFEEDEIVKVDLDEMISKAKKEISENNPLLREYAIFKYLYDNGGLFLDGNFEFIKSINSFYEHDFFIGFADDKYLATNIIWASVPKNATIEKVLDIIRQEKCDNITDVFSQVVGTDLNNNYNYVLKFDTNSFIYPYDYFYPIDYEKIGKDFSSNVKAIYYDNKKSVPARKRTKLGITKKYGPTACEYVGAVAKNVRNTIGHKKYMTMQKLRTRYSLKKDAGIEETLKVLDEYIQKKKDGKNIDYVIIHNPRWLGVTSATKELFENLLPMQEIFLNSNVEKIVDKIIELDVQQVIFSAFNYGWDKIAVRIREKKPSIKLKSFWHGSHSQVIEEINWATNLMVIELHRAHIIDVMGTCKESLVNFYKSQRYVTAFIKNTVRLSDEMKQEIAKVKKIDDGRIHFGLYSASTDWRKNTYNQVMAASCFDNAQLEVVPLKYELKKLGYYNGLEVVGSQQHLKREELLLKMAEKDIVLYVTFSECAPMLPIESLEAGTICIMGHNHHYFKGTRLHDFLVVEREDDVNAICEKIKYALENKEEILRLYKEWKALNDAESKKSVEDFLAM